MIRVFIHRDPYRLPDEVPHPIRVIILVAIAAVIAIAVLVLAVSL